MDFTRELLPGVRLVQLRRLGDLRGNFVKTYARSVFDANGEPFDLREEFYSFSHKDVIRGMHFQRPPHDHVKLVYCPVGAVLDVLVDLRPGASQGQVANVVLSADDPAILVIPKGVAHGFKALRDDSLMIYKTSTEHAPSHDAGIRWGQLRIRLGLRAPDRLGPRPDASPARRLPRGGPAMRIFLTGGTGFVGSHVLGQALEAGHDVVALRRPGSLPRVALGREPTWIDGALDADHATALKEVDVLVHLAAHTPNPPYDSLSRCLYWNVFAPIALAEQALAAGVRKFIVAGSCFEYGRSARRSSTVGIDTPLEPDLSYPTSKAAATLAFEGFAREKAVSMKVLRLFQVFGEGEQATRLWPSMRRAALEGRDFPMSPGQQVRDFTPVQFVARRFVEALDFAGVVAGQPVVEHVATGQPQSLLEFSAHWWREWNATGRLLPGAVDYRPNEIMSLASRDSR